MSSGRLRNAAAVGEGARRAATLTVSSWLDHCDVTVLFCRRTSAYIPTNSPKKLLKVSLNYTALWVAHSLLIEWSTDCRLY